jgi:hypothetical protein
MNLITLGMLIACLGQTDAPRPVPHVAQPAYRLDDVIRFPVEPYVPQPGDIFLATDRSGLLRLGHAAVGGAGVHHSGIVFARPDGTLGLIEAGPHNLLVVKVMDPYEHMISHYNAGERVWVRRRRVPLTPEQSARLTAFLAPQDGKPFALARGLRFMTPWSVRGALRTPFVGRSHGPDRARYFCSELVVESLVGAGLMDGDTARPSATLPRDLFFGRSGNSYLDRHLDMEPGWLPPSRWLPGPPSPVAVTDQVTPQSGPPRP